MGSLILMRIFIDSSMHVATDFSTYVVEFDPWRCLKNYELAHSVSISLELKQWQRVFSSQQVISIFLLHWVV